MTQRSLLLKCIDCGVERLVRYSIKNHTHLRCRSCGRKQAAKSMIKENHFGWKNGQTLNKRDGYLYIRLYPNDLFFSMGVKGNPRDNARYVRQHRFLMAQKLGRPLTNSEVVHHINNNKQDNRIENLELISAQQHNGVTTLEQKVYRLEQENKKLKQLLIEYAKQKGL